MMKIRNIAALIALCILGTAGIAMAGEPVDWGLGLQDAASPVKERMVEFHNLMLVIITGIVLFVLGLMIYIMIRFNAKANPTPSKTAHNTLLEIIWTAVPIAILVVIGIPSIKLLYFTERNFEPELTVKVTGFQWAWKYEYPDHEGLSFDAYMIPDEEIDESKGQKRLLSTDNQLVLPVDTNIQILVTASDVIHSFAVPAFGIKTDAVPGRLNETWVRINKEGTYYGQCSEICGKGHAYMPSEIRAVSKDDFEAWLETAKDEYVSYDDFKSQNIKLANYKDNKDVQ